MELAWIWESAFIVIVGMLLLRIAGRKSISHSSVATTVIMISIAQQWFNRSLIIIFGSH